MSKNEIPLSQANKEHKKILFTTLMAHRYYELIKHIIKTRREKTFFPLENYLRKGDRPPTSLCYEAFLLVFALVDNLVRYYKICERMPDIEVDGKKPIAQSTIREELKKHLGILKEARNKLQHIDEYLMDGGDGSFLGAICWTKNENLFLLFWAETGQGKEAYSIPYDTVLQRYISNFCYVHNKVLYDLEKSLEFLEKHHGWLSNSIRIETNGKPYSPEQEFIGIHLEPPRIINSE